MANGLVLLTMGRGLGRGRVMEGRVRARVMGK